MAEHLQESEEKTGAALDAIKQPNIDKLTFSDVEQAIGGQ